jgi:N-methylhydantoinase A
MCTADMRYVGQGFEVDVVVPAGPYDRDPVDAFRHAFEAEYQNLYGRLCPDISIECVNWRLTATGPEPRVDLQKWWHTAGGTAADARKGERRAYIPSLNDFETVPVYDRYRLPVGAALQGPAIIEERESTIVLNGPGRITVDEFGNVVMDLSA